MTGWHPRLRSNLNSLVEFSPQHSFAVAVAECVIMLKTKILLGTLWAFTAVNLTFVVTALSVYG